MIKTNLELKLSLKKTLIRQINNKKMNKQTMNQVTKPMIQLEEFKILISSSLNIKLFNRNHNKHLILFQNISNKKLKSKKKIKSEYKLLRKQGKNLKKNMKYNNKNHNPLFNLILTYNDLPIVDKIIQNKI